MEIGYRESCALEMKVAEPLVRPENLGKVFLHNCAR
jgi:hypothetical protein